MWSIRSTQKSKACVALRIGIGVGEHSKRTKATCTMYSPQPYIFFKTNSIYNSLHDVALECGSPHCLHRKWHSI